MASTSRLNLIKVIAAEGQSASSQMYLQSLVTSLNKEVVEYYSRPYNQSSVEYQHQPHLEFTTEGSWTAYQQSLIEKDGAPVESTFNPALFVKEMDAINSLHPQITEDGMNDGSETPAQMSAKATTVPSKTTYMPSSMRDLFLVSSPDTHLSTVHFGIVFFMSILNIFSIVLRNLDYSFLFLSIFLFPYSL